MNKQEIEQGVLAMLHQQLGEHTKLQTPFRDDPEFDSLDALELVMEFEDEFEVGIADTDAEKMRSGQDVVDFLCTRLQVTT